VLARCELCCAAKLPQFLSPHGYCLDDGPCIERAQRRLGITGYRREPGQIGGKESKRRLAVCLTACAAYRESNWQPPTAVPVDVDSQTEFECTN
jgi:hypothetical protein